MPYLLQLAQSYNDPESVNYRLAYLREQMEQDKLNLGDLAYADQVQLAMLGETIQVGGYLRTELLAAKSIKAEHLNVDDLAAISGRFSGNVYVGGDLLVGGQGVLSVLSYVSGGELNGYQRVGYWNFGYGEQAMAQVTTFIPSGFTVTRATMFIKSMPMHRVASEIYPTGYYHARNLKLYKSNSSQDGEIVSVSEMAGFYLEFGRSGRIDITQSVLGVSSFSPTGSGIKVYEGDITNHINATGRTVFLVQSTDSATTASPYAGGLQFEVFIEGYKS